MAKSTYYYLKAIFLAIVYFISLYEVHAQVHLVKDFTTQPQSSSAWEDRMKQVGNVFYFTAYTNTYGRELWRSDGTASGTVLVKDILPGFRDSEIQFLNALNGILYFVANDYEHGSELWRSDGTAAGTYLVKDIHEGDQGTWFINFAVAGGNLYFIINDGNYQLWKMSDAEPTMIKELNYMSGLTASGNDVYFSGDITPGERELWRSDGTTEGTAVVKDISGPGVSSGANYITNVNGTIYFAGYTNANGLELWKTDGTEAGTVIVKDIADGNAHASPQNLTTSGNKLYFTAYNPSTERELWVTDGTNTTLVRDINPGGTTLFSSFLGLNGSLYFAARDSRGTELWRSDGTTVGTDIIADIAPGSNGSYPTRLTFVNGQIYFTANDTQNGYEVWKTDGTASGTVMTKNIREAVDETTPYALIALGQNLYFWADDEVHGNELWVSRSNGVTELVKDIATGNDWTGFETLITDGDFAWFTDYNTGLWTTDGTDEGTTLVFDAPETEYRQFLKTAKGMYAIAHNNEDNSEVLLLFDGVSPMPIEIAVDFTLIRNLVDVDGVLYFAGEAQGKGMELWKSNGDLHDVTMVMDIRPGPLGSSPSSLTNHNGALYFKADDGVNGSELWICEGGTALGTRMIKDIYPGAGSSNIQEIISTGKAVYFTATDAQGSELWTTDGTEEGTHLVTDIWPGAGSGSPYGLVAFDNKVYFFAMDPDHGFELWTSDGTEEGSKLLKDTYPGNDYMDYMPDNLTVVNGSLYMSASDGEHGVELWKSDGTAEGTFMVKDLTPGPKGSELYWLSDQNGRLFFVANNELWRSNGTECSTLRILDNTQVSFLDYLTPVTAGNKLFFYGLSPESGGELYYYDFSTINDPGCTQTITFEEIDAKLVGDASFELHATSSAGLPITFSVTNNDLVSIEGNIVTIHAAGEVVIKASQAGDISYSPAFAEQTLIINKKQQTITFAELPEKVADNAPFELTATSSSGLAVTYTSTDNNVISISGDIVTIVGPGEASITATQEGNDEYYAALPVTQTLVVKPVVIIEIKKQQVITFEELPEKIAGEAPFTLAATSTSGLAVSYISSNNAVATIDNNTVIIKGPGEATITATQDGNDEYEAAFPVTRTLVVKLVTGFEEDVEKLVTVFPNPATDYVFVDGSALHEGALLSLLDVSGRIIDSSMADQQYSFDVRNLSSGIYFVRITTDNFTVTKRIIRK